MTDDLAYDRYDVVLARAQDELNRRMEAHRITRERYSVPVSLAAMVHTMLYTPETAMTRSQLADCLAVAIDRLMSNPSYVTRSTAQSEDKGA